MSVLLWPVKALFAVILFVISTVGRIVAASIGLFFVVIGLIFTATVVFMPLGIPMFLFGSLILIFSVI